MGAKDNFSQAVKELLNPMSDSGSSASRNESRQDKKGAEQVRVGVPAAPTATSTKSSSVTTLAEDTVVIGEMRIGGDFELHGSVKGNVTARGDVRLAGKIVGNVEANNITLTGSAIKGDVTSRGKMTVNSTAMVLGNVHATDLELDGRVKGDVNASGNTTLNESAIVLGNIYSGTIDMKNGARVQGELHITKLESAEGAFKDVDFDINL